MTDDITTYLPDFPAQGHKIIYFEATNPPSALAFPPLLLYFPTRLLPIG